MFIKNTASSEQTVHHTLTNNKQVCKQNLKNDENIHVCKLQVKLGTDHFNEILPATAKINNKNKGKQQQT